MATDNVTPFRSGPKGTGGPSRRKRCARYRQIRAVVLEEFAESDEMAVSQVLAGLQGVCVALDECTGSDATLEQSARLSAAARVLSTLLRNQQGDFVMSYRVLKELPRQPEGEAAE